VTDDLRRRANDLFLDALDHDTASRELFVVRSCGAEEALRAEVEELLRAHRAADAFLGKPAIERLLAHGAELRPGDRVGAYRIVRLLGAGGGGAVYEAMQESPSRRVALKVLGAGPATSSSRLRLQAEADILARLQHPDVATVYEAGFHESLPYFAMEFVEGARTLLQYAREEGLGVRERLALVARAADAVHHGHQKGILHRDLKPGNLLVDSAGRLKVIDFGIARLAGGGGGRPEIAGTLPYMSPEQLDPGHDEDVRADVYALGVVLYEILAERLPHDAARSPTPEAARRIREAPAPPLSRTDRRLRGDVEAIVRKAMEPDRERRYVSAAALAADLRRHLAHLPVEARTGGPLYHMAKAARRQPLAFGALAALLLVLAAATVAGARLAARNAAARRDAERNAREARSIAYVANLSAAVAAFRIHDLREARLHLAAVPEDLRGWEWSHLWSRLDASFARIEWDRRIYAGALAADGSLVAATSTEPEAQVWTDSGRGVRSFADLLMRADAVAISPDGSRLLLGYARGAEIRPLSGTGGGIALEQHGDWINAVAFHPTLPVCATGCRGGVLRFWDATTGEARGEIRCHEDRIVALAFDPAGARVATGGRDGVVRVWGFPDGALQRELRGHEGSVEDVAWSPDSGRLASASRDLGVRVFDVATGALLASAHRHSANVRSVAWSPNGDLLASGSYDRTVRLWDARDLREVACLLGHEDIVMRVGFHPRDGSIVSLGAEGTVRFWHAAPKDDVPTLATRDPALAGLAFGPDGTRLVSWSRRGAAQVWDVAARKEVALLAPRAQAVAVDPVRGLALVGTASRAAVHDLVDGSLVRTAKHHGRLIRGDRVFDLAGAVEARDAADGALLARSEELGTAHHLAVDATGETVAVAPDGRILLLDASLRTTARRVLAGPVYALAISACGRYVGMVLKGSHGAVVLRARDLTPMLELEGHAACVLDLAFSPDGTRLATGAQDLTVRIWEIPSGRQLVTLHGHAQAVSRLAWSPDGACLASGDSPADFPSTIKLWETR
jgi:WD40 repeat protein